MPKVSAVVLAAGLSTRMKGRQKLFLPYDGTTIVERVIQQVSRSRVHETIVVSSPDTHARLSGVLQTTQKLVTNLEHRSGMTSSIKAGVAACSPQSDGFMICLGDMPLIQTDDYNLLLKGFSGKLKSVNRLIVVPTHDGRRGNPIIFSASFKEDLLNHPEPEGCKAILKSFPDSIESISLSSRCIFQDVDDPDSYQQLSRSE